MTMIRRWTLAAAATFLALAAATQAQSFEIRTHTLKNGLKILVQEDRSIPNVALYTFYRIGSRNERPGTTGLSHYFEHMMFNGAEKYGPGEFDRVMEAAGGNNNAYTTRDLTVYQDWFPRSALDLIFDLEADRIENLKLDPKVVESERGVVANERRLRVDNSNFGALSEQLWATAFSAHPYQWPVVGWMSDIESWSREDLRKHFEMGYSPSNATMVVVGAVSPDEIFALADKYLEPIPAHDPPPPIRTSEPEQRGERRVELRKFAQVPLLMVAYQVPQSASEDTYPLQVIETLLFSGQSSRMYKRLVDRDQLALFVGGGSDFSFDPGLFTIASQPKEGVDPSAVEKAVYDEIGKLASGEISDREFQKAKNILLADFYRRMKTISGKANAIGTYEVYFGDYRKLFTAAEDLEKVTKDDIQRVATHYFTAKNRTVATLIPEQPEEAVSGSNQ